MTRYELQTRIFKLTMELYPTYQHHEVYNLLQTLWKREHPALVKYYNTLQEITQ